jgi:anti-anti-sigma factor
MTQIGRQNKGWSSASTARPSGVSIARADRTDAAVVVVAGELDAHSASVLVDAIEAVVASGAPEVRVDVAGVGFTDSAGLRSLVIGQRRASAHGLRFRVIGAHGALARLVELTGLSALFTG